MSTYTYARGLIKHAEKSGISLDDLSATLSRIPGSLSDFYRKNRIPINRILAGAAATGLPALMFGNGDLYDRAKKGFLYGSVGGALSGIAHAGGIWDGLKPEVADPRYLYRGNA